MVYRQSLELHFSESTVYIIIKIAPILLEDLCSCTSSRLQGICLSLKWYLTSQHFATYIFLYHCMIPDLFFVAKLNALKMYYSDLLNK